MNALDHAVIVSYVLAMLALGWVYRHQESRRDYFLGGRAFGWFPLALSAMATQLSAISFISAPAFVGVRDGGGMIWLSYELAVPLAMALLMWAILPRLYRAGFVSIYEFIDARFGRETRFLLSLVFQTSRAFGTGVMVYALALILERMMNIPFWGTIALVGIVTAIYSLQGGMKAVVYSDAAQMIIIFLGIFLCTALAIAALGGLGPLFAGAPTERLLAVDFSRTGFHGDEFGFWPMLFGGIVLYASYYGCDQTQAQRLLSAHDEGVMRKVLLANGLLRFPVVLLYCLMGLALGALALKDPRLSLSALGGVADRLVPTFILSYLPHGLIGLLVVAILAAAMSSLSSVINSLSAVSTEDISLVVKGIDERRYVLISRLAALFWAIVILAFSLFAGDIADTVIEAINKVGSIFYGPILATFALATTTRAVRGSAANIGILGGVGVNLVLWLMVPQVFWFWWNLAGFLATMGFAFVAEGLRRRAWPHLALDGETGELPPPWRETFLLTAWFAAIVALLVAIPSLWDVIGGLIG